MARAKKCHWYSDKQTHTHSHKMNFSTSSLSLQELLASFLHHGYNLLLGLHRHLHEDHWHLHRDLVNRQPLWFHKIRRDGQSAGSNDCITRWEGRESANCQIGTYMTYHMPQAEEAPLTLPRPQHGATSSTLRTIIIGAPSPFCTGAPFNGIQTLTGQERLKVLCLSVFIPRPRTVYLWERLLL